MAQRNESIGPTQRGLNELEASQSPIDEQIDQACKILQLDAGSLASTQSCKELISKAQHITAYLGREQWLLRWLLSRLQTSGSAGARVRAEPKAWRLLDVLIHKIPLANVARHFKNHKFLELFSLALQEAITSGNNLHGDRDRDELIGSVSQAEAASRIANYDSEASESSNTLMESPGNSPARKSRKRKRGPSIVASKEQAGLGKHTTRFLDQSTSPFQVLASVVHFTKDVQTWQHLEHDDYEKEYMKSVLRCEPNAAARILGQSFDLAYMTLSVCEGASAHSVYPVEPLRFRDIIDSALAMWDYRSGMVDDVEGNASNEAFASQCLVPVMLLKEVLGASSWSGLSSERIVEAVESLLSLHIFSPARAAFMFSHSDSILLDCYLTTLRDSCLLLDDVDKTSNIRSARSTTLMKTVSQLFSLATKPPGGKGLKGRNNAKPWFEHVFRKLAEAAGIETSPKMNSKLNAHQLLTLEELLQVASNKTKYLGTTTLRAIAINYGNLFIDDEQDDRWSLLEKLLELDSNVFSIPVHDDTIPPKARGAQNPLLQALFARIAYRTSHPGYGMSAAQESIQRRILIRLMEELATARALSSFLQVWHESLSELEERRSGLLDQGLPSDIPVITLLESQNISVALAKVLEISLTTKQIASDLELLERSIRLMPESMLVKERAQGRSGLVVAEAIFLALSRQDSIDSLREHGSMFTEMLLQQIRADAWPQSHMWRVWKLLGLIHTIWPQIPSWEANSSLGAESLANLRLAFLRASTIFDGNFRKHLTADSAIYREAYEAFGCMLSFAETYVMNRKSDLEGSLDLVNKMLLVTARLLKPGKHYAKCSQPTANDESRTSLQVSWNGSPDGLSSRKILALALALAARLVSQYPFALPLCPPTVRRDILQSVYWFASRTPNASREPDISSGISFLNVWEGILESEFLLNHGEVKDDLIDVLLAECQPPDDTQETKETVASLNEVAVKSLSKLPLALLRRKERKIILDCLMRDLLRPVKQLTFYQLIAHMSLMVKLMRVHNATMALVTDPSILWKLSEQLHKFDGAHNILISSVFEEIVIQALSHIVSTKDQDRSWQYLKETHHRFRELVRSGDSFINRPFLLSLLKCVLTVLWSNQKTLTFLDIEDLYASRARYFQTLVSDINVLHNERESRTSSLSNSPNLLVAAVSDVPGLDGLATWDFVKIIKDLLEAFVLSPDENKHAQNALAANNNLSIAIVKVMASIGWSNKAVLVRSIGSLLSRELAPRDWAEIRLLIQKSILSLKTDDRLRLLEELAEGTSGNISDDASLLCIRIALRASNDDADNAKDALSRIYYSLCEKLKRLNRKRHFQLAIDCMETILVTKESAISQWGVETTLACIVFMTSSHSPRLSPRYSGFIYIRLCGLMNGILTVHRLKLRGRFHLIIPVLQGLLRCLFIPQTWVHASSANVHALPSWLPPTGSLGVPHATAYARLLTTTCDPSVSTVTRRKHQSHQELTPATDKARKVAGQFLPYVLMEYAQCRLHSNILPEVKAALLPGLHAILDSTNQETLRMVNAAMDASSRAIFKTLYQDYKRFENWNDR